MAFLNIKNIIKMILGGNYMKKILIDTDLGDDIDDSAALIIALNSPEFDIVGITTVYKDTQKRAEMVKEICEMYNKDIPIYAGRKDPLISKIEDDYEPVQYSILKKKYTVNHLEIEAAKFIIKMVKEHEDLIILAMGMMTNLALAFLMDEKTMKKANIIGMGGNFKEPLPEWNIKCDVEAARIVCDKAQNLILFGLDVTRELLLTETFISQIQKNERTEYYFDGVNVFKNTFDYPLRLHDVILLIYLLNNQVSPLIRCDYTVELTGDYTRGSMVKQMNPYEGIYITNKNFYYAYAIDLDLFYKIVKERLR